MFDFGRANESQKKAIMHKDGPLLITAGPGTGKTFTLVQRTVYLIQEHGIKPEQIMIATFTEKAAKEIITRITNELLSKDISVNLNEMYVGTFHSICLRMIKEHLEYTTVRKNYRMLDSFDQTYTVYRALGRFEEIEGFSELFRNESRWKNAADVCSMVNGITEELIDNNDLLNDDDAELNTIGRIIELYRIILHEQNLLDFTAIQTEAYFMLKNNPHILSEIQEKLRYIMIDEYQDTNYIQEQLVFMLAGERKNIAVVGDDDQGLYRFRGATIRNILEFPDKFADGECEVINLDINYRSDSRIVDFYNDWMHNTDIHGRPAFEWKNFRFDKKIKPHKKSRITSPAVIKISGPELELQWHMNVLGFIKKLRESGKITDLNQIAFLCKSVKSPKIRDLMDYLEQNGINVYSPRSDMFFMREEIRLLIGCLVLSFPNYCDRLEERDFNTPMSDSLYNYYTGCIDLAENYVCYEDEDDDYVFSELNELVNEFRSAHENLTKETDYAFTHILYRLLGVSPFREILDRDMHSGAVDLRPLRNIAQFSNITAKFEYLHNVAVFKPEHFESDVEKFFNLYLRVMRRSGMNEHEDDSEYAPSGCVSFLTIHQSKGMEFPVVVVDSLGSTPKDRNEAASRIARKCIDKYSGRTEFEPAGSIKYFDFWRLYYTAFSRAQDLLVLTCCESTRIPSKYFRERYDALSNYDDPQFDVSEFDFASVKDVNLKAAYSFTGHISLYDNCPKQYKFFKELGFSAVRVGATIFGSLIHQTIEDVHRAVLRDEEHLVNDENLRLWLDMNYATISMNEHAYLGEIQLNAALRQVKGYVDRQNGDWSRIRQAEVDVSLVKPEYILEGTVDLITGDNDTVEIIDFKSEKKSDALANPERLEHYHQQLQVYAHLVEERTGKKVSAMHLYYPGTDGDDPMIDFEKNEQSISSTIARFDETVQKIQSRDFSCGAADKRFCTNCDFRYYCNK